MSHFSVVNYHTLQLIEEEDLKDNTVLFCSPLDGLSLLAQIIAIILCTLKEITVLVISNEESPLPLSGSSSGSSLSP